MSFLNTKHSLFILGPDDKNLMMSSLKSYDPFFFDPNLKIFFWNFSLLFYMFGYLFKIFTLKDSFFSLVKSAYLTALIKEIKANIVITAIDNNIHLFKASRILHKKIRFIILQNGTKFYDNKFFYKDMSNIFLPELVCWGEYDQVKISNSLAKVNKFHLFGSAYDMKARELSHLYRDFKKGNRKIKYGICLISEDFTNWNDKFPGLEEASGKIAKYCERYCKENGLKLAIALKSPKESKKRESELKFLKRYIELNDPRVVLSENKHWWSSYDFAIESTISVGMASSMLIENASRGLRVLICDFYSKEWSLGCNPPLVLKNDNPSYELFRERIDNTLSKSDAEFYEENRDQISYFISNNSNGTFENTIKSIIES